MAQRLRQSAHEVKMPNNKSHLPLTQCPDSYARELLEIAAKCLHCNSEEDYREVFKMLNNIIPFDMATSGLAELGNENDIIAYELINISYPEEWLKIYNKNNFSESDVIVRENFTSFTPQYWENTYKQHKPSRRIVSLAADFNIRHGYTFGSKPFGFCKNASLYSFSGNFKNYDAAIISVLQTIVPHMHLASSSIAEVRKKQNSKKILSEREKEVLNWLTHGKSSWDIATIMGISESTVNFHVYNIIGKLDVANRSQAVAVAIHLGLLDID